MISSSRWRLEERFQGERNGWPKYRRQSSRVVLLTKLQRLDSFCVLYVGNRFSVTYSFSLRKHGFFSPAFCLLVFNMSNTLDTTEQHVLKFYLPWAIVSLG